MRRGAGTIIRIPPGKRTQHPPRAAPFRQLFTPKAPRLPSCARFPIFLLSSRVLDVPPAPSRPLPPEIHPSKPRRPPPRPPTRSHKEIPALMDGQTPLLSGPQAALPANLSFFFFFFFFKPILMRRSQPRGAAGAAGLTATFFGGCRLPPAPPKNHPGTIRVHPGALPVGWVPFGVWLSTAAWWRALIFFIFFFFFIFGGLAACPPHSIFPLSCNP